LTIEDLKQKASQWGAHGASGRDVPAAEVLPHLDSDDRNVRVAALRVLAFSEEPAAADGILRGLDDPMKRVREVAAKSSVRFVTDERVVARLRQAVEDDETGSARPAMQILSGLYSAPFGLMSLGPIADALAALMDTKHRNQVLVSLLRARTLSDETIALLRDFVTTGTKEEAVFATRRLDGFRVERTELISDAAARATAERAWGSLWFWVKAET
jgi:hypothetical protein